MLKLSIILMCITFSLPAFALNGFDRIDQCSKLLNRFDHSRSLRKRNKTMGAWAQSCSYYGEIKANSNIVAKIDGIDDHLDQKIAESKGNVRETASEEIFY